METSVLPHKNGLPPPPFLRGKSSHRPKQAHQQPPKPPAARSCDPMTEMLENIGLLLTDYECTDQQAWNPRTTVLLRRVPGDGLWLKCRRNAEAIMLTHNFDSVYVLTLDLMHRPFGKRYIRPILLAESHSHHEHAQDINLLVPITMYSDLINTRCWKKHEVTDLPPGFECGFSRVLNQPTVSGEENESQPVIIVTCFNRASDLHTMNEAIQTRQVSQFETLDRPMNKQSRQIEIQTSIQESEPTQIQGLYLTLEILYRATQCFFTSIASTTLNMLCQTAHGREAFWGFPCTAFLRQGQWTMKRHRIRRRLITSDPKNSVDIGVSSGLAVDDVEVSDTSSSKSRRLEPWNGVCLFSYSAPYPTTQLLTAGAGLVLFLTPNGKRETRLVLASR
ncbi:hypothetical protein HZ326_28786 [Fusarium oxysporum f. sp. albedinis]|nr:hypothetical protein HZ326_28786 [Fusarium oxysporum f. sp. albedinis]